MTKIISFSDSKAADIERGFYPWVRKILWRRAWLPIPVFFPENTMERGGWLASVHRVAESQTGLKRLSTYTRTKMGFI